MLRCIVDQPEERPLKGPITYRAVQATAPGTLELTSKTTTDPGPGEVRIHVEACGVCHSDSATVEGILPIQWPRVPGHEAVGRIDLVGQGVEGWAVGQRVGIGFLGGACGYCADCPAGDPVNCANHSQPRVPHHTGHTASANPNASALIAAP